MQMYIPYQLVVLAMDCPCSWLLFISIRV